MKRLGKANNEEEADIDITPMLDVVFIMLIFFIVTASFVKESGLDINKPPASNEPPNSGDRWNQVGQCSATDDFDNAGHLNVRCYINKLFLKS